MHAKVLAAGPHAHHHHAEAHSPPRALLLSWHHGLAAGLEGQHAAYGPTCRLAKRWLGCQLMGSQLGDEAVELLVAAAFCGPAAAPPPASRITGACLALVVGVGCGVGTFGGEGRQSFVPLCDPPVLTPHPSAARQACCASCSCWRPTPGSAPRCWWTQSGRLGRARGARCWRSTTRAARQAPRPPCSSPRRETSTPAAGAHRARASRSTASRGRPPLPPARVGPCTRGPAPAACPLQLGLLRPPPWCNQFPDGAR
jgi:hypothetical protein